MDGGPDGFVEGFRRYDRALSLLRRYHSHRIVGVGNLPEGGAVLAFNHSLATYDSLICGAAIFHLIGRLPRPILDRLYFKLGLGGAVQSGGAIQGTRGVATDTVRSGKLLAVAPGGTREMLMLQRQKYEVDWERRLGFVKVSIEAQVPIVLAACPRGDDIFDVYPNPLTRWVHRRVKAPLPLFRGIGLSVVPRPVRLVHQLSEPIYPPAGADAADEGAVIAHHSLVTAKMQDLMARTLHLD